MSRLRHSRASSFSYWIYPENQNQYMTRVTKGKTCANIYFCFIWFNKYSKFFIKSSDGLPAGIWKCVRPIRLGVRFSPSPFLLQFRSVKHVRNCLKYLRLIYTRLCIFTSKELWMLKATAPSCLLLGWERYLMNYRR